MIQRLGLGFYLVLMPIFTFGSDAASQSLEAVSGDDTVSYAIYGTGDPTLVLVHGWSNTRTFWEPHISTLSQRYRTVALDLAGFGESSGYRSDWTMASFADDIAAVMDQINTEQAIVVGFSMGGAAAIELASRSRNDVLGVVLVDVLLDVESRPTDGFIDTVLTDTRNNWRDPKYLRGALSPHASQTLIRRYFSRTPEIVPEKWWPSLRNFFLWVRNDMRPTLNQINVPIAAINSDRTPTTVEAWRSYVPDFSVHILNHVGHLGAIWERVDEFDEALVGFVERFKRFAQK